MITDEELKQWAARYREAFATDEDSNRTNELTISLVACNAFPRLIAEVRQLRGNRDVPYDVWLKKAELEAEVERLRKELVASQDYVSLLASEIRRLRKLDKSW